MSMNKVNLRLSEFWSQSRMNFGRTTSFLIVIRQEYLMNCSVKWKKLFPSKELVFAHTYSSRLSKKRIPTQKSELVNLASGVGGGEEAAGRTSEASLIFSYCVEVFK